MDNSILLDRTIFEGNFLPEKIVAREGQIKEIAKCLEPVNNNDYTVYLYIHGFPGVGKTLIVRSILEGHFRKKFIYIDCFDDNTKRDIMEQVIAQSGIFLSGRISYRDLLKRFQKAKKRYIICLDRCEFIKEPDIIETFVRSSCGIILISNQSLYQSRLALRENSRIYVDEIEFKPYAHKEIYQILQERISFGLAPNVISDKLVSLIAKLSNGDARKALQIVKLSARDADISSSDKITMENIKQGIEKTKNKSINEMLEKLNPDEKTIFDILQENKRMNSGELYKTYKDVSKKKVSDRTFRNHMTSLKKHRLVKDEGITKAKSYSVA